MVEVYFANDNDEYLELQISPRGKFSLLFFTVKLGQTGRKVLTAM